MESRVGTDFMCAIGLDVGGTKIAGGIVSFPSGTVLAKRAIPTGAQRGGEAVLADAADLVARLIEQATTLERSVQGVGIGVPELVNPEGNVMSDHAIAWRGVDVAAPFRALASTVVDSDVRVAAVAEALLGAGRGFATFTYVSVGTGISYSLVQDGHVYAGARGNALVLGTSPLTTICTECGTVLQPVLEDFAGGPALVARYNVHAAQPVERGEDVLRAAETGNPHAIHVVRTAGEALGTSVGFLVNVLDPAAIIMGGGLGQAEGLYWTSFVESTREHIYADTSRGVPILRARFGADAGLIGAAALIWQRMGTAE